MTQKQLEQQLRNAPRGIPHVELPTDENLITWMKNLIANQEAIWCQHLDGTYYFIHLKGNPLPVKGVSVYKWQQPEIKKGILNGTRK